MARSARVEFGDFQTPAGLAHRVCGMLRRQDLMPGSVVEPTCGTGSFLRAASSSFPECELFLGYEINPDHVRVAKELQEADVRRVDFFEQDWPRTLGRLRAPVLVVGNPPWVTNSTVGALGGSNLPTKTNFHHRGGMEALTGKSNFDISEWMISHLLECLSGRRAALAMLCKTSVARKVLRRAWTQDLEIATAAIYLIDSAKHFRVSVDACLLLCVLEPGATSKECAVFPRLEASTRQSTIAFRQGQLVADLALFETYGHLAGVSPHRWRSGIKHDCSRVMELRIRQGLNGFENGLGEVVHLEPDHLYPMLKSSDLMKPRPLPSRYMLVPQQLVGEDTSGIKSGAPRTWAYLMSHSGRLDRRASSIYRNRPRFSIFGVGPYSFAPWKVAISGLYKRLEFRCVGPIENKPVVLDDTCYFLPCRTQRDAELLIEILNSKTANGYLGSLIFWDAKRPITAQLLNSLDLETLATPSGISLPHW